MKEIHKVSYYETDFGIVKIIGEDMDRIFFKPDYHKNRKEYVAWKASNSKIEDGINKLAEGIWLSGKQLKSVVVE